MRKAFKKIVHIGRTMDSGELFCSINWTADGRLSITGVEGPKRNGDCIGAFGQIVTHEWNIGRYTEGWNAEKVAQFREYWKRWHLNEMQAGSPDQESYLRANTVTADYVKASAALKAVGLNPDPNYQHNGKPYMYGSEWLREEVPAEVVDWLHALPETDTTPAWV